MSKTIFMLALYGVILSLCSRELCMHPGLLNISLNGRLRKLLLLPPTAPAKVSLLVVISQLLAGCMILLFLLTLPLQGALLPWADRINRIYTLALKIHLLGGPLLSLLDIGICRVRRQIHLHGRK